MKIIQYAIFTLLLFSCSQNDNSNIIINDDNTEDHIDSSTDDSNADHHFLFIGNSLTASNNLPKIIRDKYEELGILISVTSETPPSFALEDHWNTGIIQGLISSNYYDYVIIQQGPSSQEQGRLSLIEYGGRIAELCNASETKLAFFMVWPSLSYYDTFDDVIANYTEASLINSAILCPVGSYWKYYFEQSDDFSYYGSDGFHPSLEGSERAAQIIIQSLDL